MSPGTVRLNDVGEFNEIGMIFEVLHAYTSGFFLPFDDDSLE